MSNDLLLGIDIGSTTVKASLLEAHGEHRVVQTGSRRYPSLHPRPGWVEQRPEDWWSALGAVFAEFGDRLSRVSAVGVTGQGSTAVLLDDAGVALAPAISWQDPRAADIASDLAVRLDDDLRRAHGNGTGDSPEPRMLWARAEQSDVFSRTTQALSVSAYIIHRLTGQVGVSEGDAGSWLSWNLHDSRWDDDIAAAVGLRALLPEVVRSGHPVGQVSAAASRETGLPESAVVIATTTDLGAAAVSTGAAGLADIHYSKGTGGFVTAQILAPADDVPFVVLPFGKDGLYHYSAGAPTLGSALAWCAEIIGVDDPAVAAELAATAQPGAGGVIALPWLQGTTFPFTDSSARGAFLGLSRSTRPADLVRAVMEASSLEVADQIRQLVPLLERPVERIVASGGPTRNALWNVLDASAIGLPVHVAPRADAAVGAALIAGEGIGLWSDANLVGRAISGPLPQVDPDPGLAAGFAERLRVAGDIAVALRPLMPAIASLGISPSRLDPKL